VDIPFNKTFAAKQTPNCIVCGESFSLSLAASQANQDVCRSFDCQRVYALKKDGFVQFVELQKIFLRKFNADRLQFKREQGQRRGEIVAQEAQENKAMFSAVLASNPQLQKKGLCPVVVTSAVKHVANVSKKRLRRYRDQLTRIISEAFIALHQTSKDCSPRADFQNDEPSLAPTLLSLNEQLCSVCQGGCCVNGGERAYLTADTIKCYVSLNPTLRPQHVLAAYLAKIPTQAVAGSCIHHTVRGCSLPRDMCSDACHRFLCKPLTHFNEKNSEQEPMQGVVVMVRARDITKHRDFNEANPITCVAIVDNNEIKFFPLSSLAH